MTMGDFFAPRQRNRSKRQCEDESASCDKSVDDEPQETVNVKSENVRRSSRLSAQAAAAAITRALQVTAMKSH